MLQILFKKDSKDFVAKVVFASQKKDLNKKNIPDIALPDAFHEGIFQFYHEGKWWFLVLQENSIPFYDHNESIRRQGNALFLRLKNIHAGSILIENYAQKEAFLNFLEGFLLSTYSFDKYKSSFGNKIEKVTITSLQLKKEVDELWNLCKCVFITRDLVNEPQEFLTAQTFSQLMVESGQKSGLKVEVLTLPKIKSLKMNGLLAVNKGSENPPAFTIIEWKPENHQNNKPIILVGKGIVFDTGGLNIKTADGMSTMKCDMAGGAAVFGTMLALADNKIPLHVIALIPATDNRPAKNAYAPGDVIRFMNGKTVEVLNTDAEGRLVLADALCYASKLNPGIVIDMATLTGAAVRALGDYVAAVMGTATQKEFELLEKAANQTFERIAIQPFWDDYSELLKSHVADLKNIGGPLAGHITAGKFLQEFTEYPWIHIDIAGPSFMEKNYYYWGTGGTGFGVRLIYHYLINKLYASKK